MRRIKRFTRGSGRAELERGITATPGTDPRTKSRVACLLIGSVRRLYFRRLDVSFLTATTSHLQHAANSWLSCHSRGRHCTRPTKVAHTGPTWHWCVTKQWRKANITRVKRTRSWPVVRARRAFHVRSGPRQRVSPRGIQCKCRGPSSTSRALIGTQSWALFTRLGVS